MTAICAIMSALSSPRVSITDQLVYSTGTSPGVTSTYTIDSDRTAKDNGLVIETWLRDGVSSSYEVRATLTSGTLSAGTTGSWLSCSTDRSWTVTRGAFGIETAVVLIEIRDAGSGTVRDSATITISAERESGGGGG